LANEQFLSILFKINILS